VKVIQQGVGYVDSPNTLTCCHVLFLKAVDRNSHPSRNKYFRANATRSKILKITESAIFSH
jgi:hypothetical protein